MPALKSFSSVEEEDDQLCRIPEADRFNPEAEEVEEKDPEQMDKKEEDNNDVEDKKDEGHVKRDKKEEDEVEAENEKALEVKDLKERSQSSSSEAQSESEYMDIELSDIRSDVQCPICLGIIKKTRTVMECLHRFCQECIDKSMRLGNNECPACRKHCASRRSLRDDPNFDAFIAALFKDIAQFEKEELAFNENEEARKKQIQVSIAQVSQRQSESLVKRRSGVLPRTQHIGNSSKRRRQNCRNMEQNTSEAHDDDDDDGNNNISKDSSSDESCPETLQRKRKRRRTSRSTTYPSSSANNNKCEDNIIKEAHNSRGILTWGGGGARSNTRQWNNNQGSISKTVRNDHWSRLWEYTRLKSNNVEEDIHLKIISLDTKCLPNLPQSYLCCRPTLLVKQLREYVAVQMELKTEEVELLVSKEDDKTLSLSIEKMISLKDDETLANLKVDSHGNLIVVYQQKQIG